MFDNRDKAASTADRNAQEDVVLLMGLRRGLPEHSGESEPVVVQRVGGDVVLTLDDGEEIVLDALELTSAIKPRLRVAA